MKSKKIKEILNIILGALYLRPFITAARTLILIEAGYGHFKSSMRWESVDSSGVPIPWYTYPAIEYFNQFDLIKSKVFEFGSGNSTLFWASKAKEITAVEDDKKWLDKVSKRAKNKKGNVKIIFAQDKYSYLSVLRTQRKLFDLIVIDGSHRPECAKIAIKKLNRGGAIILDNSNWFPKTSRFLRNSGLIEVDFAGLAPIVPYASCTSIFLRRNFNLYSKANRNFPQNPIGSIHDVQDSSAFTK